jgi:hypothetical protein
VESVRSASGEGEEAATHQEQGRWRGAAEVRDVEAAAAVRERGGDGFHAARRGARVGQIG